MNLQKILTIAIVLIGVIGFSLWVMIITNEDNNEGYISMMLRLAQFLVFGAAIIASVFSLKNIASDPAKVKKAVISVVALLAVLGISYGLSEGHEVVENGKVMATESGSKWVGTGLRVFYILATTALVTMLVSGIKKALK